MTLKTAQTPVYNLVSIVETLLPQLLTYPNPDDPLRPEHIDVPKARKKKMTTSTRHVRTKC